MVTFVNTHLDTSYGQHDYKLVARESNVVVGVVSYSVPMSEKIVHINHIEVAPSHRHAGLGQQLIKQLIRHNINHKIQWGMTTPDGTRLRQSLERQGYQRFFEWLQSQHRTSPRDDK